MHSKSLQSLELLAAALRLLQKASRTIPTEERLSQIGNALSTYLSDFSIADDDITRVRRSHAGTCRHVL